MKEMIKKLVKLVIKSIVGFALFVGVYLLTAYSFKFITTNNDYEVPQDGIEVFVVSNGVHADLCIPILENETDWNSYFNKNDFSTLKNKPKFISFGWGDKGFFLDTPTWDDLTAKTAITALFIPSPAALHVSYLEGQPILSETVKSFKVDATAFAKMEQYILSTITLKEDKPMLIDCCRYPNFNDNFYEANFSYHLFKTCNVWTNQVIKAGGVKTAIWSPFDTGILYQFKNK